MAESNTTKQTRAMIAGLLIGAGGLGAGADHWVTRATGDSISPREITLQLGTVNKTLDRMERLAEVSANQSTDLNLRMTRLEEQAKAWGKQGDTSQRQYESMEASIRELREKVDRLQPRQ